MSGAINGKRAIVTGASSGIGRAVANRFAREGAHVAVCGRDSERTQRTVDEITASGGKAFPIISDVATEDGVDATVAHAASEMGGIDILVNNAGVDAMEWFPVHEWAIEEFDRILGTNLRGPFLMSRAAIPHMIEAGGGSIVHMSSVCAITVWEGDCAYDISKAGLNMLSDHIATEYGPQGIRSNTLMPGVIATELHDSVMEAMNDGRAFERELLGRHPIGRFGNVEEVAAATLFLAQDGTHFLTGTNISIDGAYSRP